jgi:hypothetical protein
MKKTIAIANLAFEFSVNEEDILKGNHPEILENILDKIFNNVGLYPWVFERIHAPINAKSPFKKKIPGQIQLYFDSLLLLGRDFPRTISNLSGKYVELFLTLCLLSRDSMAFKNTVAVSSVSAIRFESGMMLSCFYNMSDFKFFINKVAEEHPSSEQTLSLMNMCMLAHSALIKDIVLYHMKMLYRFLNSTEDKLKLLSFDKACSKLVCEPLSTAYCQGISTLVLFNLEQDDKITNIQHELTCIFTEHTDSPLHPLNQIARRGAPLHNKLHLCMLDIYESLASTKKLENPIYLRAKEAVNSSRLKEDWDSDIEVQRQAFHYVTSGVSRLLKIRRQDIPDNIQQIVFTKWLEKENNNREAQENNWLISGEKIMKLSGTEPNTKEKVALSQEWHRL